MTVQRLLIANRGEVAIRVMRAALELGIEPVAVFSEDDDQSLHVSRSQEAVALRGTGPAAYLDVDQLVAAAATASCQALHPGYGFVSESAVLARACAAAGIVFAGPAPETLDILGDKTRARALALEAGTTSGWIVLAAGWSSSHCDA
jgi:acetyl/propionyl-CoA carboxylase alpha subunit